MRSTLSSCYEDRSLIFIFGAMRDKAIGEMAEILFPLAERVIATRADNPRSAAPDEIRQAAARTATEIEDAARCCLGAEPGRRTGWSQRRGSRNRLDIHCGRGDAIARR